MRDFSSVYGLPNALAVYALYCGGSARDVVYVGVAEKLKNRIMQHFLRRDSSVTTCTTAVSLNPDFTRMQWWHHDLFADRSKLEAAEVVAFEVLNPTLRSRGRINSQAMALLDSSDFREIMTKLFQNSCAGTLTFPCLADALRKIETLERELNELKQALLKQQQ
jgi:hypothetical protein